MTLKKTKKIFNTFCLVFDEDQLGIQSMAKILAGCSTSPHPDETDSEEQSEIDEDL